MGLGESAVESHNEDDTKGQCSMIIASRHGSQSSPIVIGADDVAAFGDDPADACNPSSDVQI